MKILRSPTLWGTGALAVLAAVALVAATLYLNPPAQKSVTFYTTDAATVRPGDQVRIAGISVGTVKDLALEGNRVRVRAQVEDSAFVGDQSQIQVRMLTVVGGYYVNIVSLGGSPLGSRPIPQERVTMPYNLMQTLARCSQDHRQGRSGSDPAVAGRSPKRPRRQQHRVSLGDHQCWQCRHVHGRQAARPDH